MSRLLAILRLPSMTHAQYESRPMRRPADPGAWKIAAWILAGITASCGLCEFVAGRF